MMDVQKSRIEAKKSGIKVENVQFRYILRKVVSGYSAVWLARLVWDQKVGGSNPSTPTIFYCNAVEYAPEFLESQITYCHSPGLL